jgi:hypothetical protein
MLVLMLVACQGDSEVNPTDDAAVVIAGSGEVSLTLSPESLDFGEVALGGAHSLEVSLANTGDADLIMTGLELPDASAGITMTTPTRYDVPAGASQSWWVTWAPVQSGELQAALTVMAGPDSGTQSPYTVALTGTGAGPELLLTQTSHDFGEVALGCEAVHEVTLLNAGNRDLTLDGISLNNDGEFSVRDQDGEALDAEQTIAPGGTLVLALHFAPLDEHLTAATLEIDSDDPLSPTARLQLSGEGYVANEHTDTFTSTGQQNATVLFAINTVALLGNYSDRFWEALPTFFDTLKGSGVSYRVAALIDTDGAVNGDTLYVTEEDSTNEAIAIFEEMTTGAASDNDYFFQTFGNALPANEDWLILENALWEDARLNLIGINNDLEQSSGNYVTWLSEYADYKDDPDDIVMHAIAGDYPGGCSGAEPFAGYYDAVEETGGVFLSICEADWGDHMETLALACLGDSRALFYLTQQPAESSLEVSVDGALQTSGWSYNAGLNAVSFAEGRFPDTGSEVAIYYYVAGECGG